MNFAIIAAGEGSRLVQEGISLPKPLVSLCGTPMIKRLIDIFLDNNAESVSVIVNEQMTEVRNYLETLAGTLPVPLNLVVKTTPSSMHSFYEVSRAFPESGKFVLTTVDTIFRPEDFSRYVKEFEQGSSDGAMAVTNFIDDEKPLYVETDHDLNITAFRDEPYQGMKYISGGIYGLTPDSLSVLHGCVERGVSRMRNFQRELVAAGLRLKAVPFSKIVDVDHAADIATAEKFLES